MLINYRAAVVCLISIVLCMPSLFVPARAQSKPTIQNSQSGILYGSNFAYAISAPKGWIMDETAGKPQGLSVVFYRKGESWTKGKAVMYVNVNDRKQGLTSKKAIAYDIGASKKANPKSSVTQGETLRTRDNRKAVTYIFKNPADKKSAKERVAYVETPTVVLLITLTSESENDFKNAVADHSALVKSIAYMGTKTNGAKAK